MDGTLPRKGRTLLAPSPAVHGLAQHTADLHSGAMPRARSIRDIPLRGRDRRRGAARRACPFDPGAGAGRQGRPALEKEHRYAGYTSYASLNDLPRRDPAFADLARLLAAMPPTLPDASFELAAQAEARQPVGKPVESRRPSQRTHSPAQHHVGHLLCRGAGRLRRDPLRGPAPAADDGRSAARATTTFVAVRSPARPAAACGKAGFATKCSPAPARASG